MLAVGANAPHGAPAMLSPGGALLAGGLLQPLCSTEHQRAQDPIVALLASDTAFAQAVNSKQLDAAAAIAVQLVKTHVTAVAQLVPRALPDGSSATTAYRAGEGAVAEPVAMQPAAETPVAVGDRVVVTAGAAKARGRGAAAAPAVGRAAAVVAFDGHGWAVIQAADTGERLRLQQRFLAHAPPEDLGGAGSPTSCAPAAFSQAGAEAVGSPRARKRPRAGVDTPEQRTALERAKAQMVELEEVIPWRAVRACWRTRRPAWRRALRKGCEGVPGVAARMQELRQALVTDGAATLAGGAAWDEAAEACAAGAPGAGLDRLLQLWADLQQGIHTWLEDRSLSGSPAEASGDNAEADAAPAPSGPAASGPASARIAFVAADSPLDVPCAHLDTPFEGWAAGAGEGWGSEPEYASDEFDSGAETEREEGSDVTVMCDSD
ncbi:hypothetical protein WJX81_006084 [Elliptochloris bilobata]|uniref:Tudor domain-containing protein n=1 Tax=Elliptochloris bilobata TaxID=381761 RepID=A0AAW1R3A3_9CHLO